MKKIKIFLFLITLFLLTPIFAFADNSFPDFPMSFYGTATLDGTPLPVGSKIQAYEGSTLRGEVILSEAGIYGYDDPTRAKLVVGNFTENLIFKYVLVNSTTTGGGGGAIIIFPPPPIIIPYLNPETGCSIQEYTNGFISGISILKNLTFTTCETIDTVAPVITLLGNSSVNIYRGDIYTDAGATALDNVDGNITSNIVTVNSVNTAIIGTYTVTYNVSDAAGNAAPQVTRTVRVSNRPSGGGGGGGGNPDVTPTTSTTTQQVLGEKISYTEGKWVKTSDSKTVYFVDNNNVRHAYPNQNIWKSYFGNDFSFVITITKEELASYPLDRNVPYKSGAMFKISSIPKVYRVGEDRLIQWLKTEDAAKRLYGNNWNKLIQDLPDGFFGDYVMGEDIE